MGKGRFGEDCRGGMLQLMGQSLKNNQTPQKAEPFLVLHLPASKRGWSGMVTAEFLCGGKLLCSGAVPQAS